MKRIILFLSFLVFFMNSMNLVFSLCTRTNPCCCEDRCWIEGACCKKDQPGEFWHPTGCYDFEVWAEPQIMKFTVGRKTPINLYVKNIEDYTDRYNIDYWIDSSNPAVISVDLFGFESTENVAPQEIKKLNPRITILAKSASGTIWFNVTSWGEPTIYRDASLTVIPSDLPVSLVEFSHFGFFVLVTSIVLIYYMINKFNR